MAHLPYFSLLDSRFSFFWQQFYQKKRMEMLADTFYIAFKRHIAVSKAKLI